MRVYEFEMQEKFEWVIPDADDDFEIFRTFNGTTRSSTWTPIRMKLLREGEATLPSDMPWFRDGVPVLKRTAVDALGPLLRNDGEFLPLECNEADLWAFNGTTILDALDVDRSDLVRFSSGRIMRVNSYVFRSDRLQNVFAFKVPGLLRSALFVTEEVVVRAATLTGVGFKLLWEGDQ